MELDRDESREVLETLEKRSKANKSLYGFPIREPDIRRKETHKFYDIKGLWSRHKEIINLDSLGYKNTEIAKMLGIHPVTVSMTINSTLGKGAQLALREERDGEYEELREEVMDLTRKSLDKYREILDAESAGYKIQKEVADVITLDLAGMRAPTRIESKSAHMVLSSDEIEEFKRRGMRAAKASGKLIEVESEKTE
uniref:Uncharacterized protein n=1 Tax=viral metagenome TaxID=1070528 RepID=A0A6M3XPG8_9ZZZZ